MPKKIAVLLIALALNIGAFLPQVQLLTTIDIKTRHPLQVKMERLGYPAALASSVVLAAQRSNLKPELIVALMKTESDFKHDAKSSKGYQGYMQIPFKIHDADINIMIGAKILAEKVRISKGDLIKAICLYKGYPHESRRGQEKARMVIRLYEELEGMEV